MTDLISPRRGCALLLMCPIVYGLYHLTICLVLSCCPSSEGTVGPIRNMNVNVTVTVTVTSYPPRPHNTVNSCVTAYEILCLKIQRARIPSMLLVF